MVSFPATDLLGQTVLTRKPLWGLDLTKLFAGTFVPCCLHFHLLLHKTTMTSVCPLVLVLRNCRTTRGAQSEGASVVLAEAIS